MTTNELLSRARHLVTSADPDTIKASALLAAAHVAGSGLPEVLSDYFVSHCVEAHPWDVSGIDYTLDSGASPESIIIDPEGRRVYSHPGKGIPGAVWHRRHYTLAVITSAYCPVTVRRLTLECALYLEALAQGDIDDPQCQERLRAWDQVYWSAPRCWDPDEYLHQDLDQVLMDCLESTPEEVAKIIVDEASSDALLDLEETSEYLESTLEEWREQLEEGCMDLDPPASFGDLDLTAVFNRAWTTRNLPVISAFTHLLEVDEFDESWQALAQALGGAR